MVKAKGNPCYKVAKSLAELCFCSSVFWKIEFISNEIGLLTEEISRQNVKEQLGSSQLLIVKYDRRETY